MNRLSVLHFPSGAIEPDSGTNFGELGLVETISTPVCRELYSATLRASGDFSNEVVHGAPSGKGGPLRGDAQENARANLHHPAKQTRR